MWKSVLILLQAADRWNLRFHYGGAHSSIWAFPQSVFAPINWVSWSPFFPFLSIKKSIMTLSDFLSFLFRIHDCLVFLIGVCISTRLAPNCPGVSDSIVAGCMGRQTSGLSLSTWPWSTQSYLCNTLTPEIGQASLFPFMVFGYSGLIQLLPLERVSWLGVSLEKVFFFFQHWALPRPWGWGKCSYLKNLIFHHRWWVDILSLTVKGLGRTSGCPFPF